MNKIEFFEFHNDQIFASVIKYILNQVLTLCIPYNLKVMRKWIICELANNS